MKNLLLILTLLISICLSAQVAIGKATVDGDGILDFGADDNKGILLPRIISLDAGSVPGTLYYDTSDSKVKFLGSTTVDLSVKDVQAANQFQITDEGYNNLNEIADLNGTILGAETSTVPGVLILESEEHALILPKVTSYTNVGDPEAGMIVYDQTKKLFCVYDGEKWAFWGKE